MNQRNRTSLMVSREEHQLLRRVAERERLSVAQASSIAIQMLVNAKRSEIDAEYDVLLDRMAKQRRDARRS